MGKIDEIRVRDIMRKLEKKVLRLREILLTAKPLSW